MFTGSTRNARRFNTEVERYLDHNDISIVPVGTVEFYGGFPLDSETVTSEAFALKMAQEADGLVLTNLPYSMQAPPPWRGERHR